MKALSKELRPLHVIILFVLLGSVAYLIKGWQFGISHPASGDAREYLEFAKVLWNHKYPDDPYRMFLDRWPGFPLLLDLAWLIAGYNPIWQNLINVVAVLAIPSLVFYLVYKEAGWTPALACLLLLSVNPLIYDNAIAGMTESMFSLLLVLMYLIGRNLPGRPWLLSVPLALTVLLLVLFKEEGSFTAIYILVLFCIYYYRNRLFSVKSVAAILVACLVGYVSLHLYKNFLASNDIMPIRYRGGSSMFFRYFLSDKMDFRDGARGFSHMTYLGWLKLLSVPELFKILGGSLLAMWTTFNRLIFPGGIVLLLAGLIFSFRKGYRLETMLLLPLILNYSFTFQISGEYRYLIPFYFICLPLGLLGLKEITGKISPHAGNRVVIGLFTAFSIACIGNWYVYAPWHKHQDTRIDQNADNSSFLKLQFNAERLLYKGEFQQALNEIRPALSQKPNWIFFHLCEGLSYYGLGEKEKAFQQVEKAIDLSPYIVETYYVGYYLYSLEGNASRAKQLLEKIVSMRPEFAPLRELLEEYRTQMNDKSHELPKAERSPFRYYLTQPLLKNNAYSSLNNYIQILNTLFPSRHLHLLEFQSP